MRLGWLVVMGGALVVAVGGCFGAPPSCDSACFNPQPEPPKFCDCESDGSATSAGHTSAATGGNTAASSGTGAMSTGTSGTGGTTGTGTTGSAGGMGGMGGGGIGGMGGMGGSGGALSSSVTGN